MFRQLTSFENLIYAHKKAMKGCRKTKQICQFNFDMEKEILVLQQDLITQTYRPGSFRYFTIHDPKKRTIAVAPFCDRVVHHAIVNVLEPIYEKRFIYHSYASRKNKGTHKAIEQAQQFARRRPWYVKIDIEQYFASIDHGVLEGLIHKKVKDCRTNKLIKRIVQRLENNGQGLPIGNLTSQFFANVYLDIFDHFIKDELGIKGYLRYMDDCVIFGWSKKQVLKRLEKAQIFLNTFLKLTINPKALRIGKSVSGLSFLGMVIYPSTIRLRSINKKRSFKRIKLKENQWSSSHIDDASLVASLQSVMAHLNSFVTIRYEER